MRTEVQVVSPELPLGELERRFIEKSVSGFPVAKNGKLVGIVSRSDVVRAYCVEQSLSETVTYLYQIHTDEGSDVAAEAEQVADRVADRLEHFCVQDIMVSKVISVSPETTLVEVAKTLVEHDIHRVPVTEKNRVVGIISTLDLTRLIADERARIVT